MNNENLSPEAPLARFLVEKKHFSIDKMAVKPKAFEPNRNLELSVYRILNLKADKIWSIGQEFVATPREKALYGYGEVIVQVFEDQGLGIVPDESPPRHANVIGWPEEKHFQKSLQQQIAAEAKLILVPVS